MKKLIPVAVRLQRNPNIKLYGLPWSFPGWLGDSRGQPYRNVTTTAMYVIRWILGAQKQYNLTIDYIGVNSHLLFVIFNYYSKTVFKYNTVRLYELCC